MNTSTDRIERSIVLKAPIRQVWRMLSDAEEFGSWFGVALQGKTMKAGEELAGQVTYPGYEHVTLRVVIERLDAPTYLSWRWHPHAIDPQVDYAGEPTTLVEFTLQEVPEGTRLTVVESGFDAIPASRRAEAFRGNSGGWTAQMQNIEKHAAT